MNRFIVCVFSILVLVGGTRAVRANPKTVPEAIEAACATDAKSWSSVEHDELTKMCSPPPATTGESYFAALCSGVRALNAKLVVAIDSDSALTLQQTCGLGHAVSAVIPSVLVDVVSGLGNHIVAVARQDLVDYITLNLTGKFCATTADDIRALGKLFPETCKLFDADQTPSDTLTLSAVKAAFATDAKNLQKTLPDKLKSVVEAYVAKHPTLKIAFTAVSTVAFVVYDIFVAKLEPRQLLDNAVQAIIDHASTGGPCTLTAAIPDARCAALFAAILVQTIENAAPTGNVAAELPTLLGTAAIRFCNVGHNPAPGVATCVVDPRLDKAQRLYNAVYQLYKLQSALLSEASANAAGSKLVTKTSFPSLAAAIRELVDAFLTLCDDGTTEYANASKLTLSLTDLALAATQEDLAGMRTPLLDILDNPIVVDKLGSKLDDLTKKAVNLVIALAAANDASEAKTVIDAFAAPAGTYKEKYGRSRNYLALGSVVGPMAALQTQYLDGVRQSGTTNVFRMSAPVGIEFMPTCASGKWVNLGIAVTVLDPLAMAAADTKGNTPDTNLGAVLDLGAYLRLGIAKSPLSLVAGFSWRPGLHSATNCTTDCYDQTRELFIGIGVDVPLLVIH
jgi:hypothetical protein